MKYVKLHISFKDKLLFIFFNLFPDDKLNISETKEIIREKVITVQKDSVNRNYESDEAKLEIPFFELTNQDKVRSHLDKN